MWSACWRLLNRSKSWLTPFAVDFFTEAFLKSLPREEFWGANCPKMLKISESFKKWVISKSSKSKDITFLASKIAFTKCFSGLLHHICLQV